MNRSSTAVNENFIDKNIRQIKSVGTVLAVRKPCQKFYAIDQKGSSKARKGATNAVCLEQHLSSTNSRAPGSHCFLLISVLPMSKKMTLLAMIAFLICECA